MIIEYLSDDDNIFVSSLPISYYTTLLTKLLQMRMKYLSDEDKIFVKSLPIS